MASIEITDENPINVSLGEENTLTSSVSSPETVSVTSTDGWYEKKYEEKDPIFEKSPASDITNEDIENWNNKSDFSGDYNDLENKPELFSGDYDDLENKPTIPTKTSDLTNDSGFLTEHQDISGKVDKETGKGLSTNDFTNAYKSNVDSNTIARHTHSNKSILDDISSNDVSNWDSKQDGLISGTNIKTINNQSILGSGNITIQGGGGSGDGDMLKSVYDTNDNGIVDNAEKVNNHTVGTDVPSNAVFTDTVYDDTSIRQELNDKADSSDIPTKTSDLTNDSDFVTNARVNQLYSLNRTDINTINNTSLPAKQNTLISGTNIKTINDNSILGSGNIYLEEKNLVIETNGMGYSLYDIKTITSTSDECFIDIKSSIDSGKPFRISIEDLDSGDMRYVVAGNYEHLEHYLGQSESYSFWYTNEDTLNKITFTISGTTITTTDQSYTKQDELISGTNIKTVNGNSILGSGNILIDSGLIIDNIDGWTVIRNDSGSVAICFKRIQVNGVAITTSTASEYESGFIDATTFPTGITPTSFSASPTNGSQSSGVHIHRTAISGSKGQVVFYSNASNKSANCPLFLTVIGTYSE